MSKVYEFVGFAVPPVKVVWVVPGFVKVSTREINSTVEPPEPVFLVFATILVIFWFEFKVIVSVVVRLLLGT